MKTLQSQLKTHLHGVPWLYEGADQVQVFHRLPDLLSPAAGLVAGEQTPAANSEVVKHGRCSQC